MYLRGKFPQRSQCTNLSKRCAASSRFLAFRNEKRDLGRQREDRVLVSEEDIPHEIQEPRFQQSFYLTCRLGLLKNLLVGPYVLSRRLNVDIYLQFLSHFFIHHKIGYLFRVFFF
jgi:hypothetical protein